MSIEDQVIFEDIIAPLKTPERALLDPSFLHFMSRIPVSKKPPENTTFLVPSNFEKLLHRRDDPEYLNILVRFLQYFDYRGWYQQTRDFDVNLLIKNINILQDAGALEFVEVLEDGHFLREMLQDALEVRQFYFSLSRTRNFLKDYVLTLLELSRQNRCGILMKTRRLPTMMRDYIMTLELPSRVDQLVEKKSSFTSQLFDFPHGRAFKFFIGVTISSAGFVHPALSVPGVMFAFIDP